MLPEGLLAEAQDALPLPVEDLHLACVRAPSGRLVICGALREELAALDPSIEWLTPEAVPELGEGGVDPSVLNLRSGPFTSPLVLARRWRSHLSAAAVAIMAAALLAVGLWRHASAWNTAAGQIRATVNDRLAREAPSLSEDELAMKLPGLRASAQGADVAINDAALDLAAVLKAWPTQVKMQPPSLSVSASGVSVSVTLDGPPEAFLHDFHAPAGFIAEEPRLASADRFTRVSMQLRRAGPSAGGTP